MMKTDWAQHSSALFDAFEGERIDTIDMHTAGEPLRIILAAPFLPQGEDILARRRDAQSGSWDRLRRVLMFEPRGHQDMYGAIIVSPVTPGADFGVLFTHNEGYSTMCGHAIVALGKAAVELGWVDAVEPVTTIRIDAPAGLITAHAQVVGGKVISTTFENVPSFVAALDQTVTVRGLGDVRYDVAYGGAYYAFVDAPSVGLLLEPTNGRQIAALGMAIKHAVMDAFPLKHPEKEDLSFLYGTIFTGPAKSEAAHSRHVCVFADGAIDRSPTGTGVSARMALLFARDANIANETVRIESITGESFTGRVASTTTLHGLPAIGTEVGGTASFTGRHSFLLEPSDTLDAGFLVR
jgi:trans-L-3-hydroxyproline dehydratase